MPRFALPLALIASLVLARPAAAAELEAVFFDNALEAVERQATQRLRQVPDDPAGLAWRAEVLMKQGSFASAKSDLDKLPAGTRDAAIARGDFAWYTGDWAGALTHYGEARRLAPNDAHAAWGVASALLHLGRFDETTAAIAPLVPRAALEGASFKAWVLVVQGAALGLKADQGSILDKIANGPAARALFEEAMRTDPGNANALSAMGRFHYFAPWILGGDARRAAELLAKSNAVDPFFYLNHAYLIRALLRAGEKDKAKVEATFYRAKFAGIAAAERELADVAF